MAAAQPDALRPAALGARMVTTAPNDGVPDDDDASGTSGSSRSSPMTLSADGSHVVAVPLPSTPEWLQPGTHVSKQLSDGGFVHGIVGPLTDPVEYMKQP